MAQVRKYSKGNAITKAAEGEPIIFKWDGYGDYNVADIEKTYARNINNYINSLDLDEEDKKKVRDESFRLLQGMKSGLLTSRDASGKWANVPVGYESTGINEQKRKFLKGKQYIKDDDFYRNNAYSVLDKALQDTNIYTSPKAQSSKFDTKFENYLLKYYFRDLPFDKALWDYNTSRPNIGARLADWRKEVEASDLDDKTKADLLNRIDVGIAGIQSATTDDDFAALARVGFDARKWIDPNYVSETAETTEKPLTEEQKKQKEYTDAYQARLDDWNNKWKNQYKTWTYDSSITNPIYDRYNLQQLQDLINWNLLSSGNTTNPIISAFNKYISNKDILDSLEEAGYYQDGWYYLPNTSDISSNMITRVNPSSKTLERVPITSFKLGNEEFTKRLQLEVAKELGIAQPWTTSIPSNKDGGILKAQGGLSFNAAEAAMRKQSKRKKESDKKEKSKVSSENSKKSSSRDMTYERFMRGTASEEGRLHKNPVVPTMLITQLFGDSKTRLGKALRATELEVNSILPFGGMVNAYNLVDNNIGWKNWANFWKGLPRKTWNYLMEPIKEKKGGTIPKNQQGNVLKYQDPAFRIGAKNKWTLEDRNNAIANYNMLKDIQDYFASGGDAVGYIAAFNGGEDIYDKMVGNTNYFVNMSGDYRKEDPLAKHRQVTFRHTNKGFDDAIRNAIAGYGITEGTSNFDNYLGDRTYNRTLGWITPEQADILNKQIASTGIEFFRDPGSGRFRLRMSNNPALKTTNQDGTVNGGELPEVTVTPTKTTPNTNLSGSPAGADKPAPTTPKQLDWGNLLGTGRLIGTIATNNAIARGLKNSLSPLLLDPLQLRRQVVGDLATRNYMERLGAEANRLGARPITSDANLQLAQQLEYNNRANDYRTRGWLADKQAIDKTTAEAQKVADFNAEQRNTVANRNRAAMLGIRQAKANIEAQRKSANWQQAVAPWLMSMEMKFNENKKLNDQLNYQENQYTLGSQYDTAARQAQDNLNAAKANYLAIDGNNEAGWLTSPEYTAARKTYEQDLANATNAYQTGMLNARRKSLRYNPFLFVYKSGGRLSYKEKALLERAKDFNKSLLEDRKTFHKIIMESQKENNKLITSLSGLTKELIIKSMTYAD